MPGGSHIVLCGSDGLAIRVLDEFVALGEDVVVVVAGDDGALADRGRESGVPVVIGDVRRDVTLQRAGIGEARALALLEQDDVANIGAGRGEHRRRDRAALRMPGARDRRPLRTG